MKRIADIILWIWQLPQNMLGLLVMLFLRPVETVCDTGYARVYRTASISGGISLGCYAFVSSSLSYREEAVPQGWYGYAWYDSGRMCFNALPGCTHAELLARRYGININKLKRKRHDDIGKNQRNRTAAA